MSGFAIIGAVLFAVYEVKRRVRRDPVKQFDAARRALGRAVAECVVYEAQPRTQGEVNR